MTLPQRQVWSLVEARQALERLVGVAVDWTVLDEYLTRFVVEPSHAAHRAGLGLLRDAGNGARGPAGHAAGTAFAPIWVKARAA